MAYIISYADADIRRYPSSEGGKKKRWGRYCVVFAILAAAVFLRVKRFPEFLIPGDPQITKNAMQTMLSDIQSGSSLDDAIFVFCQSILENA